MNLNELTEQLNIDFIVPTHYFTARFCALLPVVYNLTGVSRETMYKKINNLFSNIRIGVPLL